MSFQRYPEYKDSGVEWLGEVPAHWGVLRLKNVLAQKVTDGPHTTPVFIAEGVPFLSVDGIQNGELVFDGCRFVSGEDHAEFKRKASPRRDDLLMGKAASTGKIARVKVDFDFSIWSPLALIRIKRNEALPEFVEYMLKSQATQAEIDNYCTANTQKNISMDDIPRLILTHPPIDEQAAIATFLDHETAKIDALVAEQEKLIALLQEKRQAVISHAVTKGLNPSVPMKDSGVEWLGEVPAHWTPMSIKFALKGIVDTEHKTAPFFDDGEYLVVRTANIKDGKLVLDGAKYTNKEGFAEWTKRATPQPGDIIFTREAPAGEACLVPEGVDLCLGQRTVLMQVDHSQLLAPFALWSIYGGVAAEFIDLLSQGSTVAHFNMSDIGQIPLLLPPKQEQQEIVDHLQVTTKRFDDLLSQAQSAITLLQERRTALISAAVTGQIDVRGWVPASEASIS